MQIFKHYKKIIMSCLLAIMVGLAFAPMPAFAVVAPHNVAPFPKVSFTFDDGLASTVTHAAPTLAAHGLSGTVYITIGCVGMTTVPNSCPADPDVHYMSWEQIAQLRDTYGWEIGGHASTHPQLATDGLTDAQIVAEIAGGKQALTDHGFSPISFATPYGDYDNRVLAEIAKSYASHRGFWDVDGNSWPYNNYIINNMQVQAGVPVNDVLVRIDQAIASNQWLVLTFHGIRTNPSSDPEDYEYSSTDLNTIAAYVKSKQNASMLKAVNVQDGLVASNTNLLSNADLSSGLTDGWTTDTPASVMANNGNHGSYPEPQNAALLTAGLSGNSHLLSPKVAVQHTKTYMLQSFLNLAARTSGELGYYIDEYNINNDWVSGQWKRAKTSVAVSSEAFTYTPSSANVAKARLQIYVTPGSGIQAYVDGFRWFPLQEADDLPPPPTENVLPNGNFDAGIAEGWTATNTTAFSADTTGQGSPANSDNAIKLLSGDSNASLIAPFISVDSSSTYNVSAYLNIQTLSGQEIAFYIDEYDIGGNWISGQYKAAKRDTGIEIISFDYQQTSTAVKKAGLQIILVANSGVTGYLDDVRFLAPAGAPPPDGLNLVSNGAFDAGIADGWTTNDPVNISADTTGQGSPANPDNAIKLVSSSQDRHLFSPLVAVSSGSSYSLQGYLDLRQITGGEIGFYIDEYNINGDWISGQYKTGISIISAGDVGFAYTSTTENVVSAGLQIILTGNSGILAYLDDIRWFKD